MARMPKMSACVMSVSGQDGITGPSAASAPMTMTAKIARRRITRSRRPYSTGPAKQPRGANGEDQGHRGEEREVGQLGEERLAEVVEEADEEAARHGPRQAPESAHDHHHEGVREHLGVRTGVDTEEARADDAAEGGEGGA